MRLLVVALLLQACVSSSIQLGEEPLDSGPDITVVDAQGLDAGAPDVMTMEDTGCPLGALPPMETCYDDRCNVIVPSCEEECDPAPEHCLFSCDGDTDCQVGYDCCDTTGDSCGFVARNAEAHRNHVAMCGEPVVPMDIGAVCVAGTCELESPTIPGCTSEDQCIVIVSTDLACGETMAMTEDRVDEYIDHLCPPDDTTPECCDYLRDETTRRPAACVESVCVPAD